MCRAEKPVAFGERLITAGYGCVESRRRWPPALRRSTDEPRAEPGDRRAAHVLPRRRPRLARAGRDAAQPVPAGAHKAPAGARGADGLPAAQPVLAWRDADRRRAAALRAGAPAARAVGRP